MSNKLIVPHHDPYFGKDNSGVSCTIRYDYLEAMLRQAGDLRPDEVISGFRVDAYGIQYVIEKR